MTLKKTNLKLKIYFTLKLIDLLTCTVAFGSHANVQKHFSLKFRLFPDTTKNTIIVRITRPINKVAKPLPKTIIQ